MVAVLSATDKNANVTIGGGGLTATSASSAFCAGRGDTTTTVIGSGIKRYWEITITTLTGGSNSAGTGFCTASETFADNAYLGEQPHGPGYYEDGNVYFNNGGGGGVIATMPTFAAGDVICWAYDGGNKSWVRKNNGNWINDVIGNQNPATGTGGFDSTGFGDAFPAYCVKNNALVTANFGATAFAFTPPSGFTGFDSPAAAIDVVPGEVAVEGATLTVAAASGAAAVDVVPAFVEVVGATLDIAGFGAIEVVPSSIEITGATLEISADAADAIAVVPGEVAIVGATLTVGQQKILVIPGELAAVGATLTVAAPIGIVVVVPGAARIVGATLTIGAGSTEEVPLYGVPYVGPFLTGIPNIDLHLTAAASVDPLLAGTVYIG